MNKECKFCGDDCLCEYHRIATTTDGINVIIEDTIEIPRSWLEGLVKHKEAVVQAASLGVDISTRTNTRQWESINLLCGYINSAEHILELNQKKDERIHKND